MSLDNPQLQVAAVCRGLAAYGLGSGIGGHVSVREPDRDRYWMNVLDKTFEEVTPDDVVQLDFAGHQVDGDRIVSLGADFHHGIYQARDDVQAIVHTHGPWITALCALNRPVGMWHNLATFFHDNCALSPDDTFEAIAPNLGTNNTILIPYHGAITVSGSLGHAAALHVTLEYAAELDVRMAATDATPMPEAMIHEVKDLVTRAGYLSLTFGLLLRKAVAHVEASGQDWLTADVAAEVAA